MLERDMFACRPRRFDDVMEWYWKYDRVVCVL